MIKLILLCFSLLLVGCSEKDEKQFFLDSTENLLKPVIEEENFSIQWTNFLDEKKNVAKQKKNVVRYPEGLFLITDEVSPVYPEIEGFAVFDFSELKDKKILEFCDNFVNRIKDKEFPVDVLSEDFVHSKFYFSEYIVNLPKITNYFIGQPEIGDDCWEFPLYFFYDNTKKSQGTIQIRKKTDTLVVDFFQLGQLYE